MTGLANLRKRTVGVIALLLFSAAITFTSLHFVHKHESKSGHERDHVTCAFCLFQQSVAAAITTTPSSDLEHVLVFSVVSHLFRLADPTSSEVSCGAGSRAPPLV